MKSAADTSAYCSSMTMPSDNLTSPSPVTGLILPGGGARNAYQVGALQALAEWLPADTANPFPVICGTSAGAFNAAMLASFASQPVEGIQRLSVV